MDRASTALAAVVRKFKAYRRSGLETPPPGSPRWSERLLYEDGVEDFLQVLDAQRVLFDVQDNLTASTAEVTANLIRLYKALGGGWAADVTEGH